MVLAGFALFLLNLSALTLEDWFLFGHLTK